MRVHALSVKMVVGITSFLLLWATAGAAGFPERPIQILVGWPVGSPTEVAVRAVAKPLSKILEQPAIVQNLPGGAGALVLGRVKIERPDGYTVFAGGSVTFAETPWSRTVPFDTLNDFAYLAQHLRFEHYVLCRSDSPWKNFDELIQHAKKNPKVIKYSSQGVGSPTHIMMEYLARKESLQWTHVPFHSATESIPALLGGHIDFAATVLGPEVEYTKTGRLRPLIGLGGKRIRLFPDLPTIVEMGYDVGDFTCVSGGIWAVPAATPKDIQKILEKALLQAMADPEARDCFKKLNREYAPLNSEETTKMVIEHYKKFGELMKQLGLGRYKK